jgi:hypothetical protein
MKPVMHRFLHFICKSATSQSLLQGSKQMKSRRCKVWTVMGSQELQISVPEGFPYYGQQNEGGHFMQQKNTTPCNNIPLHYL